MLPSNVLLYTCNLGRPIESACQRDAIDNLSMARYVPDLILFYIIYILHYEVDDIARCECPTFYTHGVNAKPFILLVASFLY